MFPSGFDELEREEVLPTVIADEDGVVERVNAAFTEAYGWTDRDLVGQPLTRIIPERYRDAHHLGFARFAVTGRTRIAEHPIELAVLTASGAERPAEHFILVTRNEDGWRFGAVVRPLE